MMKIARVEAFIVSPAWIFARVETDDGVFGWGEAGMNFRSPATAAAIRDVESILVGLDADRIEHVWQILRRSSFFRGGPVLSSALAAIDTALWDLRGRALGQPLSSLLGGRVRDRIRAYAWLCADDLCAPSEAEVLDELAGLRAKGHRTFKVTPPQADPIVSMSYVRRVVERLEFILSQGSDIEVAMDVHGRWSMATAYRMMKFLEPFGLLFVEEPLLAEHLDKLPLLASATSVPLATGERLFSRWDFADVLGAGLAVAQPDVALASGVSEMMRIASHAEMHDVHVAPHCPFGPIALAASLHIDARIRNFLVQEQSITHFKDSFTQYVGNMGMFDVVDGYFQCPPGPGLGVEIDEQRVRQQAGLQEALDQQLAELKDSPEATALAALATGSEFGAVGLAMLLHSPLRIKKCEYQIQFVLSKRDDSYVIGQSELKAEIHNVQTGQTQTFVFSDNDGEVLEAIYSGNRADVAFYVLGQAMQAEIAGNLLRELREQ